MNKIDFRSDTVTWPTATMRDAMRLAEVGDDVYGEDPTVNELQALAANTLGKEAGLFVASGSQGNLVSLLAAAGRGDEAIVGEANHTYNWEAGGMAVLGGIVPRVLAVDEIGRMSLAQIRAAIRPDDAHLPTSRLILLENTAGGCYGAAIPLDYFAAVREIADEHGLHVHLDGARLFNAATKLGVPARDITQYVDSVTFCLSKGLCAPVGSVVCGSAEFIHAAHRARKLVGGGMRQAGIVAAAGIVALEEMTERLHKDHANAARLAAGLAQIDGIKVEPVHTNMVFFTLHDDVTLNADAIAQQLREQHNIWIGARSARAFRAVTHYWVDEEAVDLLLKGLEQILSEPAAVNHEQQVGYYG